MSGRLDRAFYDRPALTVAAELIGKHLVHLVDDGEDGDGIGVRGGGGRRLAGRIVETEAYVGPDDLASHARRGPTPRARIMFGPPGRAYVYLIYGRYHCFNVVVERDGFPAAILVRALEPSDDTAARTDGPGKLCDALAITRAHDGADLTAADATLFLEERPEIAGAPRGPRRIVQTPRIGVDYAGEWAARPWRFVDGESQSLSRPLPRERPPRQGRARRL